MFWTASIFSLGHKRHANLAYNLLKPKKYPACCVPQRWGDSVVPEVTEAFDDTDFTVHEKMKYFACLSSFQRLDISAVIYTRITEELIG